MDETYIKVNGAWKYLYRAVDSNGQTLDFLLRAKRDAVAAKRFLQNALRAAHTVKPRVLNVDKNPAYPKAMEQLKKEQALLEGTELRQVKYRNNLIEQDHRFIKRLTRPGLGFKTFRTAWRTLRGFESMNMLRKGQIRGVSKGDIGSQVRFMESVFGLGA